MAGRGEGMVFRSNKGMEQKQERAAPPSHYPLTTARRPLAVRELYKTTVLKNFLKTVVPTGRPSTWLAKQQLENGGQATAAGVLLFSDEPQIVLPKRSAIKIYRYKTKNEQGARDTLAFQPLTIEGSMYDIIYQAVERTKELVEGIKKLGLEGLEQVSYPEETLHEIITNAVLHRDYSIASDVHVRIFDNRIEVESPGVLPGHVTVKNILNEQFARNPKLVRLINKFPNPPNKDVGEGLNTAFAAMKKLRLKAPEIIEQENTVKVVVRHDSLASPETIVMAYLDQNSTIVNRVARELTGITSENSMKDVFKKLARSDMIEQVPEKKGAASAWRKKQ
jgi:ATP-dependent DNA helicase RecG